MDAEESLIYDELAKRFKYRGKLDVWLSHDYDPAHWTPIFDKEQAQLDRLEQWARTLSKPFKTHYLRWINFYRRGIDEARTELRTKETKIRQEKYDERLRKEEEERHAYTGEIPRPPAEERTHDNQD